MPQPPSRERQGSSLAGVLAAVVILLLLVIVFFYGGFGQRNDEPRKLGTEMVGPRADKKGITVPGAVRYKALDDVCRENLSQVRQSILVYGASSPDEPYPPSLNDLHLPAEVLKCSIDPHEPYNYDPATGKVTCPHPGHGKY